LLVIFMCSIIGAEQTLCCASVQSFKLL
jgi:hypothetical protein